MAGGKWRETYLSAFDETSDATAVACVRALRRQLYTYAHYSRFARVDGSSSHQSHLKVKHPQPTTRDVHMHLSHQMHTYSVKSVK